LLAELECHVLLARWTVERVARSFVDIRSIPRRESAVACTHLALDDRADSEERVGELVPVVVVVMLGASSFTKWTCGVACAGGARITRRAEAWASGARRQRDGAPKTRRAPTTRRRADDATARRRRDGAPTTRRRADDATARRRREARTL
jgi:hypothetical protein